MAPAWPSLNASLNALTAALLIAGLLCITRRRIPAHRLCMSAAFLVSCVFLGSYLLYHARVGSMRFQRTGWVRPVYFTILGTHTVLAAAIVPLALRTLYLARYERWGAHRRLARWTLPLWLYVSVTGVVIYCMLYRWVGAGVAR